MQEKYDELELIINEIDYIISRISDRGYIGSLEVIKYEAQKELEIIEPLLQEEYER